jgi:hypothetical protein
MATIFERYQQLGRWIPKYVAVWALVLLALAATVHTAGAEPSPNSYQNGFVAACKNHGGTPKSVGTRQVKCTLGDGTTITCDFNFNPPSCTTVVPLTRPAGGITAQPTGGVLEVSEPAAAGPNPRVTTVQASDPAVIFAASDDQR